MSLPLFFLLLVAVASCYTHQAFVHGKSSQEPTLEDSSSRITVVGVVYCDTCSINTFSKQSYFLQGVEVHVNCRFKASSPKTAEEVNISVNRTTNKNGVYKLEIPHVDGIDCVDGIAIVSQCVAKLIGASDKTCNIPVFQTAANEISVKSKQDKVCIYSLSALSYKPPKKNNTICGGKKHHPHPPEDQEEKKLRDSKFFWPYLSPYWFPWPYPNLPPLPTLPPVSSLPFPYLPFGNPSPSSPAFDWRNPTTWIPYLPRFPPGEHNP